MEFRKFSSIEQFRNVIKSVNDYSKRTETPLPTLEFIGTVKLHGTNACVVFDMATQEFQYQSRERVLSLIQDNAGFMMWGSQDKIKHQFLRIVKHFSPKESIYIYGEWAGGNIQKKVGICNLPKSFYIFSVIVDGIECLTEETPINTLLEQDREIYSIYEFDTFKIKIDFNKPEASQNTLVEWTMLVEEECPVTRKLLESNPDYKDMNKVGEGIVFVNRATGLKFKCKGEKHSVSKVKTLKEIALVDVEMMESLNAFIDKVVTENRMNQGLEKLTEMGLDSKDNKNIGAFIKWVVGDVMKEEMDTIVANQFSTKMLGNRIANVARTYYMNQPL